MNSQGQENIRTEVECMLARYSDPTGQVMNILNDIQSVFRYLPAEALTIVSEEIGIPFSRLYSLGTFFSKLSVEPVGRYILEVCDGTACHAVGAPNIIQALEEKLGIKEGQTTSDGLLTLQKVHCVGACGIAPIVMVDDKIYGKVRLRQIAQIVSAIDQGE